MSITVEVPWDCFKSDGVFEYAMWIDLFIVDAVVDTEEGEESELVRACTGSGLVWTGSGLEAFSAAESETSSLSSPRYVSTI
jgi:hypothetical protein